MRKVGLEDEIPVSELTVEGIKRRLDNAKSMQLSTELENEMKLLVDWVNNEYSASKQSEALSRMYHFADKYMEEANKYLVCTKGCAHCCKAPVLITSAEATYIENHTDYAKEQLGIIQELPNKISNSYCPLLDQESAKCSVYEYRPLTCRLFGTFDHFDHCESGVTHNTHQIESVDVLEQVYHLIATDCVDGFKTTGLAAASDIRFWFTKA
ncbi:TPA: YkgJ family cysteine cluster protein [Vibrio vulnificus]|nr:hypothetical protein [Vibrio vulnificus]HDY7607748.1 YkgJ family cysteine cluster protein [Vibrio vulnificus]